MCLFTRATFYLALSLSSCWLISLSKGEAHAISTTASADIVAIKTQQKVNGLYLYSMELRNASGQPVDKVEAISGRSWTQSAHKEHIGGSKAPLPKGRYSVGSLSFDKYPVELGGVWVPIYPRFKTGRTALGLHFDPSFGKPRESGTDGCLGVFTIGDRQKLINYVRQYHPRTLIVQ